MTATSDPNLARFAPTSLADIQAAAAFLTRQDRKYLIPLSDLETCQERLDPDTRVLEIQAQRAFRYQSAYFDDDDLSAYHLARCRRGNRFKVRTRAYLDSGECQLEVKLRDGRGRTVKHRAPRHSHDLEVLVDDERRWLRAFPPVAPLTPVLDVRVLTDYVRTTLVLPGAAGRITIDRHLAFTNPAGQRFELPEMAVIETKGSGQPTSADRVLWRLGYRPVSLSKYALGMCVLDSSLPANRWHRLRNHLLAAGRFVPSGA